MQCQSEAGKSFIVERNVAEPRPHSKLSVCCSHERHTNVSGLNAHTHTHTMSSSAYQQIAKFIFAASSLQTLFFREFHNFPLCQFVFGCLAIRPMGELAGERNGNSVGDGMRRADEKKKTLNFSSSPKKKESRTVRKQKTEKLIKLLQQFFDMSSGRERATSEEQFSYLFPFVVERFAVGSAPISPRQINYQFRNRRTQKKTAWALAPQPRNDRWWMCTAFIFRTMTRHIPGRFENSIWWTSGHRQRVPQQFPSPKHIFLAPSLHLSNSFSSLRCQAGRAADEG